MIQKEREYLTLKTQANESPSDDTLCVKAATAERDFFKSLIHLTIRNNSRTKWKGWELGYVQLCSFSDIGLEYTKTERK
jgi:hypothetical protein